MQQTTPRRRCVLEFVSPDQADDEMSSILWKCHRFSTSTEQWRSRLCEGDGGSHFMRSCMCVCVPEACNVKIAGIADFEKEVGIDVWNPGMSSKQ